MKIKNAIYDLDSGGVTIALIMINKLLNKKKLYKFNSFLKNNLYKKNIFLFN